jgi:HK97 gp10 family phage protein
MTASVELEWNGPALIEDFSKRELAALQKAGQVAEETAQGLARVRTGFMRDSVFVITDVSPDGTAVLIVGDSAPYAIFNELGTYRMSAQPFIRPAGDRAAQLLPQLLAQEGGA